jgi:hypothetical protein
MHFEFFNQDQLPASLKGPFVRYVQDAPVKVHCSLSKLSRESMPHEEGDWEHFGLKRSFTSCALQAAVALDVVPRVTELLPMVRQNSFLAQLSLLDPRNVNDSIAEAIAEHLAFAGVPPAQSQPDGSNPNKAARAINYLLRQIGFRNPNANMLANGVRPLVGGPRLSLHSSRVTALQFPMYVRGEDDSVVSSRGKLALRDAASGSNPFFDGGVLKYYAKAGGAAPPTPWSSRKVIAAAVWYVCESAGVCDVCGVWRVCVCVACGVSLLRACVHVCAG